LYIIGANDAGRRLVNLKSSAKLVMIIRTDGGVIVPPLPPLLDSRLHFSQFDFAFRNRPRPKLVSLALARLNPTRYSQGPAHVFLTNGAPRRASRDE